MKEYKIETMQDIYNAVTPENYEDFLKDFTGIVKVMVANKVIGRKFKLSNFVWNDDGKRKVILKLTSNDEKEKNSS